MPYTLFVDVTGNGIGTVVVSPPGSNFSDAYSQVYHSGTSVSLFPSADVSSNFTGWSGACSGSGICNLSMNSDLTATANFALKTFSINATTVDGGAISPTGALTFDYGSNQTFNIIYNPDNYKLLNVVVDGTSQGIITSYTFTNITANHSITAYLEGINQMPELNPIMDITVNEKQPYSFAISGTDPDIPDQNLSYFIFPDTPVPCMAQTLTSESAIVWLTPTESNGPGVYTITVGVQDDGPGELVATESFQLTVNDIIDPIVWNIEELTVEKGMRFIYDIAFSDPNIPEQYTQFNLTGITPQGMTINEQTITWHTDHNTSVGQTTVSIETHESPPQTTSLTITVTPDITPPNILFDLESDRTSKNDFIIRLKANEKLSYTPTLKVTDSEDSFQNVQADGFNNDWYQYKVDISTANDGRAMIEGIAYDTSNNGRTSNATFYIDHTQPEMDCSIAGDLIGEGLKQIIITSSETLANPPAITIADVSGDAVPLTYNSQYGNQYQYNIYIDEDTSSGTGTIEISCTDLAGNPGSFSHTVEIDTVPPEFTFGAPQAVKAGYMKFWVQSDELLPNIPTVSFQAQYNTYISVPYPSINGKSYTFTCNIRSETPNGQANLGIEIADMAGNTRLKTQTILVDTISPALTITTTPNPPHGNAPIFVHAVSSEPLTSVMAMTASTDGTTPLPITLTENEGNHYTWTCNSSDIAVIQLDVTDMVGNSTQNTLSFTDIAISNVNFILSSTPGNGNDITATAIVTNIGDSRAENVVVHISKGSWGNQEIMQAFTVNLDPNESTELSVLWTVVDQDDSGVIVVTINPDNQLAEINEKNNQAHHAPAIIRSTVQRHTFHLNESSVVLGAVVYDSTTFQPVGYTEINLNLWLEDANQSIIAGPLTTSYNSNAQEYTSVLTPSALSCPPGMYTLVWQITGANYATTSSFEAIELIRDYTITVQTPQTVYSRTSPVEITGQVLDSLNEPLQNEIVNIFLQSQYGPRYFTTETDINGYYTFQYTPQWNEAGKFDITVQVSKNEEIFRTNETTFDILGLILTCPQSDLDIFSGETSHATCEIRNVGTTALTNVSITVTEKGSAISQWDLDQDSLTGTLSARQRVYVNFDWIAGQTPGTHEFLMEISSDQGEYEVENFQLSVKSKNASVRFDPNQMEVFVPIDGSVTRNLRLINTGWQDAQNAALTSEMPNWIYLADIDPIVGTLPGNKGLSDVGFGYLTKYSLIGRIGTDGQTFQLGTNMTYKAYTSGELFLRINEADSELSDNSGYLSVQINSIDSQNLVDIQADDGWQATGIRLDADEDINVSTNDTWLTSETESRDADGNGVKEFTIIWSPTSHDFSESNGPFDENLRLSGSNFSDISMIFRAWVISDELCSARIMVTNALADPIPNAIVKLYAVKYNPVVGTFQNYSAKTNANGEAQFAEMPPGPYGYVIRSDEYEDRSGQIEIELAIDFYETIILKPNNVDIEFTVTETKIKDVYQTTVRVLYKTQDNPILIGAPINRSIRPGSAVTGQIVLKNVGYTAAKNVVFTMPEMGKYVDMYFQVLSGSELVEKSSTHVDTIEKNERITHLKYIIYVDSLAPLSYQFNGSISLNYSYVSTSGRDHQGATIIPVSVKTPPKRNYFNIDPPGITKIISQDDPIIQLNTDLWSEIGSLTVTNMGEDKAVKIQDPAGLLVKGSIGIDFISLVKTFFGLGIFSPLSLDFSLVAGKWDFVNETEPLDPGASAIMTVDKFNDNLVKDVLTGKPFNMLNIGVDLFSGCAGFVGFKSKWESSTGQISDWDYAIAPISIITVRDYDGKRTVTYNPPDDDTYYPPYVPTVYPTESTGYYEPITYRAPPIVWKDGYVIFDIQQETSFDRQAFNAELKIDNNSESAPLSQVSVRIEVADENQNILFNDHRDCEMLFFSTPDLWDVDTIDGNGSIQPDTEAKSKWLIIPTRDAGGKSYYLTAHLSWTWNGISENMQSEAVLINVDYQPVVKLEYFIQKTFESEIPFYLGVRAVNTGEAPVNNLSIQCKQPFIRWSNSLILNPYITVLRAVDSENVVADKNLTIKIKSLDPQDSAIAFWELSASPGGKVLDFRIVDVHHAENLGGQSTSLLDVSTTTYWIDHYGTVDDLENQMVVLIPDTENVPNCVLHMMNRNYEPVHFVSPTITQNISFDSNQMDLSIGPQPDADKWIYTTVNNSLSDSKRLKSVQTSSGKNIDSRNFWQTGDEIHILATVTENISLNFEDYNKTTSGELFLDKVQYSGKYAKAIVTVLDADCNINPGEKNDAIEILLGSETETNSETISLTEVEAGLFTGTFGFDLAKTPDNGNIFVENGKFFSVSYAESTDALGNPSQITRTAQWIANSFPVIAQGESLTVIMDEDGTPTGWTAPQLSAIDADGDALTWVLAQVPSQGTATVSGSRNSPEVFNYSPKALWSGSDQFKIKIYDGIGGEDIIFINVSVLDVNDAPEIYLGNIQKVNKNSVLSISSAITITDEDVFSNPMIINLSTANGILALSNTSGLTVLSQDTTSQSLQGSVTQINAAITHITYTPTTNYSGQTGITVTANDQGFTGPGDIKISEKLLPIVVIDQNQAPEISSPISVDMIEDMPFQFTNIVITDPDAADDPVQITLTAENVFISLYETQNLQFAIGDGRSDQFLSFFDSVSNLNTALAQMTLTSTTDYSGMAKITVTVNDQGYNGTGSALQDSAAISITVHQINDAPRFKLSKSSIIVDEDFTESQSLTVIVGLNPVNETSQSFTYSLSPASSEIVSVTINENTGQITINAISEQNGYQKFGVVADDGMSENNTSIEYFDLTVNSVNDPPNFELSKNIIIANEDFTESQSITIVMEQIPENETEQAITFSLSPASSQIASITINENTGQITIDAMSNKNGHQIFSVIANDGMPDNNTVENSFALTNNSINDSPDFELSRNTITVLEDFTETQSITVTIELVPDDEISQAVTFSLSPSSSAIAGITINENTGQILIDAILNRHGYQEFSVIANDGESENNISTQNFALTITSVNDPPAFELSRNLITVDEDFTEPQSITVIMGLIPDDEAAQSITFSLSPASSQIA